MDKKNGNLIDFILIEISKGNEMAFEQLFLQYQPKVVSFLTGLTHDSSISRDMAQEIFLAIWRDRSRLARVDSISSYLYQMARNKAFDYFDHLSVVDRYVDDYLGRGSEEYADVEEGLFARELKCLIERVIDEMPPQRQRVFRMSREYGLSNDEIASRLNISKRTVENHLTAALAVLRKVLVLFILFWRV